MKLIRFLFLGLISTGSIFAESVQIPSNVDHSAWNSLLKAFVDDRGFVDYAAWKGDPEALKKLDGYLDQFKPQPSSPGPGRDEAIAGLLNLYNALTIDWILRNYPVVSIRKTKKPWKEKRFLVGGNQVSLDEIEHETLRPWIGWKVHSVIVCAARSCPPLSRLAYTADNWEGQMRERYRAWFSREDLHQYFPSENRVVVSKIFQWFSEDFSGESSVANLLRRFGPDQYKSLLEQSNLNIQFGEYHWGLNDQSDLGANYNHGWF